MISHQFGVLPDTDDIWHEENGCILMDVLAAWFGDVGFDIADFGGYTGWIASAKVKISV